MRQEEQPQPCMRSSSGKAGIAPLALPVRLECIQSVSFSESDHGSEQEMFAISPSAEMPPAHLPPSSLSLSPEQEKFRRDYRQFRSGEVGKPQPAAYEKTLLSHLSQGRLKAASSKSNENRGLCGMERAREQTLRAPSERQVRTPPVPPLRQLLRLPLASVVPSECERPPYSPCSPSEDPGSPCFPGGLTRQKTITVSQAWADQNKTLAKMVSFLSDVPINMPWWLSFFGFQQSQFRPATVKRLFTMVLFCCLGAALAMQLVHLRDRSISGRFGNEVILVMALCSSACVLQLNLRRPGGAIYSASDLRDVHE
ncbi:unnamed protein product [Polarella glacialis]|uniref:Transmembrane protein n=1 Tax=Polarella glacialis TaxID=89957 RepID=A0A813LT81_POLGL|nr:unnamed protein product [Polarella glacialis]